jgi:hypothetical protein
MNGEAAFGRKRSLNAGDSSMRGMKIRSLFFAFIHTPMM